MNLSASICLPYSIYVLTLNYICFIRIGPEVFCVGQLLMLSILNSEDPCISQVLPADPIPLRVFSYSF